MSMSGQFVAIEADDIEELLKDSSKIGDHLEKLEESESPDSSRTVEQAWDVVRVLLPEAIGDEFLDSDVGEGGVLYMPASDVKTAAFSLLKRDMQALSEEFATDPSAEGDLYWADYWAKNPEDLAGYFKEVADFFDKAAKRGASVFFIVG